MGERQNRFDAPGEILCGHLDQGLLVAVGGLNCDPFAGRPDLGRIRRVYVRPAWRDKGIGRALVTALIEQARTHFRCVRLRAENAERHASTRALALRPIVKPRRYPYPAIRSVPDDSRSFWKWQLCGCMFRDCSNLQQYATRRLRFMENRIEKRIEIAAPVSRVWQALTDSRQFGEWFLVKDGRAVCGRQAGGRPDYSSWI